MKTFAVIFDIAEGGFQLYNKEQWIAALKEWRRDLLEEGLGHDQVLDAEEVVDLIFGEEAYVSEVPADAEHVFFDMAEGGFEFFGAAGMRYVEEALQEFIEPTGKSIDCLVEEYGDLASAIQDITHGDLYYAEVKRFKNGE